MSAIMQVCTCTVYVWCVRVCVCVCVCALAYILPGDNDDLEDRGLLGLRDDFFFPADELVEPVTTTTLRGSCNMYIYHVTGTYVYIQMNIYFIHTPRKGGVEVVLVESSTREAFFALSCSFFFF